VRSSVKFSVGEEGPEFSASEGVRGVGRARVMEPDRGPTDGLRDEEPEEGKVGARGGGCCRMRRRPDAPSPCSCSVMTGDLVKECGQHVLIHIYLLYPSLRVSRQAVSRPQSYALALQEQRQKQKHKPKTREPAAL
jgi:hypothetical protein